MTSAITPVAKFWSGTIGVTSSDTIKRMRLVLASASPRRAELLTTAGFTFDVEPVDVDETPHVNEAPTEYALRVARDKAAARWRLANPRPRDICVLAADTVVVADGRILGKPASAGHAREMLTLLSGTTHLVHTGVVVRGPDGEVAEVATTRVRFIDLSEAEIDWYLQTGEAEGKAGAYGIQGRASRFVDWIEGSWSNVVGLPVATVYRMLAAAGVLS
jgi:septum formation protein